MTQVSTSSKKINDKPHKVSKKSPAQFDENGVNGDGRIRYISDAAYFMALERGFAGGDSVQDWLAAEAKLDCLH